MAHMTPQDVIEHYGNGNVQAAAAKLRVTRQTIHVWIKENRVPLHWQHCIERDTAGRYKADQRWPNDPAFRKSRVTATES